MGAEDCPSSSLCHGSTPVSCAGDEETAKAIAEETDGVAAMPLKGTRGARSCAARGRNGPNLVYGRSAYDRDPLRVTVVAECCVGVVTLGEKS